MRASITPGDGDKRHGTENGYTNLGCRCTPCRLAVSTRIAQRRARLRGTLTPRDPRHGTINAYDNYGCRCIPCRAANAEKQRRYYQPKQ